MLVVRLKVGRRILPHVEANLLPAPIPDERQDVLAAIRLYNGVEDVWERLLARNRPAVKFELAAWSCSDDIDLTIGERGAVRRAHNLPLLIGQQRNAAE
jgi:hypothetical protein